VNLSAQKLWLTATLTALLFSAACSRQTEGTPKPSQTKGTNSSEAISGDRDLALVRVVAAVPSEPAVDILADNRIVFPELRYKTVTEYRPLTDERHTFRVKPTGNTAQELLAEDSEGLSGGRHYTLVAYPRGNGKTELTAFSDNLTPPHEGKAKVRVIHAAPEAGEIDVYAVGRDTLFSGLESGSNSQYTELNPMEVTLQIRPEGKQTALLNLDNVKFDAGGIYTIVLLGHSQLSPHMEAIKIEDRVAGTPTGRLQSVALPL